MKISDFDYDLPDERIARFPLDERDSSKLLVWRSSPSVKTDGQFAQSSPPGLSPNISETTFSNICSVLPAGSLLVFNNTRVVRARLVMHKPMPERSTATSGARIEILCLEPSQPADYERAFAVRDACEWHCMIGNSKRWKDGIVECAGLRARRLDGDVVSFMWESDETFGEVLERLGRVPIPPYLGRESDEVDDTRYQTVYAAIEGSVAAPTAGLHFTPELMERLRSGGVETDEVTLHVGAGTFLPVKVGNALDHSMHTEYFEVTLVAIEHLLKRSGNVIAVGTTSVRTLESLVVLGWRIRQTGEPEPDRPVGQFEPHDIPADFDGPMALGLLAEWMHARGLEKIAASTRIMITPAGFRFRIVDGLVTNFHQPKSTLLLLVSAFTHGRWREIYDYALGRGFRFLSYGDSSLLLR